jgi:3-oxoacyl-[acyl-carrier protein] reductase
MDLGLRGLRALVTGSSRGLGYAAALLLAGEGAEVAINSRKSEAVIAAGQAIQAASGNSQVFPLTGNVADPQVPERLVAEAAAAMGGLDILITNSGGPPSGSFASFDDAAWQKALELVFLSHVRLIRSGLPYLQASASPAVLTVTSYSVKQPISNLVLSTSIRAATVGLTKSLALELGSAGIRFNSILPGWTETERVYELMADRAGRNHTTVEEELRKQAKDSPLGRLGRPEEFAKAAVFLVSPAASYITGLMMTVDGGMYKGML